MKKKVMSKLTINIIFLFVIGLLFGCAGDSSPGYEYMPNMYRSPGIETYGEHNIPGFDGMPVDGTIPRSYLSTFSFEDDLAGYKLAGGYKLDSGATLVDHNGDPIKEDGNLIILKKDTIIGGQSIYPDSVYEINGDLIAFRLNEKTLNAGKLLYKMMCAHCHGEQGSGDGTMTKHNPYKGTPAFNDGEKIRPRSNLPMTKFTEGHMFHTITYGVKGTGMGPHASLITEQERWKIIYYIKEKLQE